MYTNIEAISSIEAAAKWPVCVASGWLHHISSLILTQIIPTSGRLVYSCVWGVKDGWGWDFTSSMSPPSFIYNVYIHIYVCIYSNVSLPFHTAIPNLPHQCI